MPKTKQIKCSVCGQTIRTMYGALAMRDVPVVCRRCFGHQTYDVPTSRGANPANVPEQAAGDI
jgi:ribosomal protein L37E